jgi:hypothetical protein
MVWVETAAQSPVHRASINVCAGLCGGTEVVGFCLSDRAAAGKLARCSAQTAFAKVEAVSAMHLNLSYKILNVRRFTYNRNYNS